MSYDKEEANTWFKIGYEDETRKREKTNAVFNTIRENVREEKKEETDIEMAKREASEGRGYYSLVMAANIVAGLPKSMALHHGLPSYLIWAKAASARRHRWRVSGELTRPKDDFAIPVRQVQRAEESFVYLSDFVEWAMEAGCMLERSAIDTAKQKCAVSDTFEHRARLWEIEQTRLELLSAKGGSVEAILAREERLAELARERSEIISLLWGDQFVRELTDAPAPMPVANAGWPQASASHEKRWREWIQLALQILDEPLPPTAMTDLARRVQKRGKVTEGIECIRKRIAVDSVRVRIDTLKLGNR